MLGGQNKVGGTLIDPTTGQHVQTNWPSLTSERYFLVLKQPLILLGLICRLGTYPKCVDQFKKNPFAKKVISM